MLLSVSVTVASQISLGKYYAGGQQINGFHHRSISTLCVWSVYWTTTPPLRLLLETIDALLQWNESPEFITPIRYSIGTTQNNCADAYKWETNPAARQRQDKSNAAHSIWHAALSFQWSSLSVWLCLDLILRSLCILPNPKGPIQVRIGKEEADFDEAVMFLEYHFLHVLCGSHATCLSHDRFLNKYWILCNPNMIDMLGLDNPLMEISLHSQSTCWNSRLMQSSGYTFK